MRVSRHILASVLLLFGLANLRCDPGQPTHSPVGETGSIAVEIAVPSSPEENDRAAKVVLAQGRFRISGEGMAILDTVFAITGSLLQGRLDDIPVGRCTVDFVFENSGGNPYWEASTGVEVRKNETATARLELSRVGDEMPEIKGVAITPPAGDPGTEFAFAADVEDIHDAADSLQVRWDFDGDGLFEVDWTYEKHGSHTYGEIGVFSARLEVKDRSRQITSTTLEVVVEGLSEVVVTTPAGTQHEMVLVPEGPFVMGAKSEESGETDEQPVHVVYLDPFYIDRYEVTNAQFQAFAEATSHIATREMEGISVVNLGSGEWLAIDGASWRAPLGPGSDLTERLDHPVVHVSWADAQTYCDWTGLRLPTEAEWEKAARGTDGRTYPWGESVDTFKANCGEGYSVGDDSDGYLLTSPVGHYPEGGSVYGSYDMIGNVWEWVEDWYDADYYSRSPSDNPEGPARGERRVMRGGSWGDPVGWARASLRGEEDPMNPNNNMGFRCIRDP